MALALVGNLGALGSQLGRLQLGGPVPAMSFARALPAATRPVIAHFYLNDGVTANTTTATASPLTRPNLKATTANGGFDAITLEFASMPAGVVSGNVCRLTEQGGDGSIVYSGIVEELPDTIGPAGTKHSILVNPPGFELDDTYVQLDYTVATDVSQMVRDAVGATMHLSCDQVSVPASTGITGQGDFRNQTAKQVIDTARSIAGPTWFWFADEQFRVWFQPQGSGSTYTFPRSQWEERTRNGGSIRDRKNDVLGIGGVPAGASAPITARYTGASQSGVNGIGVRSLNPPLSLPNITDQSTLQAIVNTVGAVLDRAWNRVDLKLLPTCGVRVHASQPGGAMVRYWEPSVDPVTETESGAGYAGPYICQAVDNDGAFQMVTAGDIAVTSQTDVDNMVASLVARAAAVGLVNAAASLSASGQATSGSLSIPPTAGGTPVASSYGTIPVLLAAAFPAGASQVIAVPAGYRALRLECSLRSTVAATSDTLRLTFNGDSAGDYDWVLFKGSGGGGAWSSSQGNGDTALSVGAVPGANAPAFAMGTLEIQIPSYLLNQDVAVASHGGLALAYSAGNLQTQSGFGAWHIGRSTQGSLVVYPGVTTMTLSLSGGNFASSAPNISLVTLYGLP